MKRFLLQAVNDEDHLAPAREVFGLDGLQAATISTAFMTASGLSLLQGVLEPIADRTRLFVGIRNGVTTVQSIQKALEIGCETYMVDTGSRQRIFHPKMYYARSAARAKLLLGSANLTMGGMRTNIEASVMQELDPATDAAFLADLEGKFDAMIADYPEHVIQAVGIDQLADLQRSGRLLDERKVRQPKAVGKSGNPELDAVPKMLLRTTPIASQAPQAPPIEIQQPQPEQAENGAVPPDVADGDLVLVWVSKPLKRAHISLPNKLGTNPKGSMSLTVGEMENIDQRHYFRDEAFEALDWAPDEKLAHKERATGSFKVLVKGINYGSHTLRLSHDTRTDTPAYEQNNYMTSLHWGETAQFVAKEELLGSTLRIFRESDNPTRFTLEID
ncbi:hypothetical protein CDO87_21130 [Sagittula sp. P11]|uniref:phospholipase D family protein n=1 Tax=Sagittula sp. P11 TaxID=2009329 RepID=UPI000C2D3804|nr:phospholipase D family protein [Sagittula sp. P11]AUC55510.1 hypothetical protein CDO87_21130 [Sagittula sp. P11]